METDSYQICTTLLPGLGAIALGWDVGLGLLGILCLLVMSGLASASEVAFFSLSPNDHERLQNDDRPSSGRILWLKSQPERLLATILIANNFINIAIVLLSDIVLAQLLPPALTLGWAQYWQDLIPWLERYNEQGMAQVLHYSITVVGVTFVLLLFGEVTPKVYSTVHGIALARVTSGALSVLMQVLSPLSSLLVRWSGGIERRLSEKQSAVGLTSKEEIDDAIEMTVSQEENSGQDLDILKSIVKFSEVSARQIMRARVDVVAVYQENTFEEVLDIIRESGYSRFPVYGEDADSVIGYLYAKDLLPHLQESPDFDWQKIIRKSAIFIPENRKISDILKDFQQQRLHMAIVVNEYGGTEGIVTLEDILEEVIGDIQDEFDDEPDIIFEKLDDNNYIFDGKTLLNDIYRITGVDTESFEAAKGEAESLAGLFLEYLGDFPTENQELNLPGFNLKALTVSEKRVERILINIVSNEEKPDDGEEVNS